MREKRAYCRICNEETIWRFNGEQYHRGKRVFDLYECKNCHSSRAFNLSREWKSLRAQINKLERRCNENNNRYS